MRVLGLVVSRQEGTRGMPIVEVLLYEDFAKEWRRGKKRKRRRKRNKGMTRGSSRGSSSGSSKYWKDESRRSISKLV